MGGVRGLCILGFFSSLLKRATLSTEFRFEQTTVKIVNKLGNKKESCFPWPCPARFPSWDSFPLNFENYCYNLSSIRQRVHYEQQWFPFLFDILLLHFIAITFFFKWPLSPHLGAFMWIRSALRLANGCFCVLENGVSESSAVKIKLRGNAWLLNGIVSRRWGVPALGMFVMLPQRRFI